MSKNQKYENITMINTYKTVIWDWNGTLLNDVWLCVEIVNQLLVNHNNLQLDETHYKEVFGFPITAYYERIGIDFQKESFESLTKKFISSYNTRVKESALHHQTLSTLNTLKRREFNQFILTAAHKKSVMPLLNHYSIQDYFIAIEGLDNHRAESKVERGKQLISNNNIDAKNAVLIGDTMHDFEVASEIGVDCILIANGHQSKNRLEERTKGQAKVLDSISQLVTG